MKMLNSRIRIWCLGMKWFKENGTKNPKYHTLLIINCFVITMVIIEIKYGKINTKIKKIKLQNKVKLQELNATKIKKNDNLNG